MMIARTIIEDVSVGHDSQDDDSMMMCLSNSHRDDSMMMCLSNSHSDAVIMVCSVKGRACKPC